MKQGDSPHPEKAALTDVVFYAERKGRYANDMTGHRWRRKEETALYGRLLMRGNGRQPPKRFGRGDAVGVQNDDH